MQYFCSTFFPVGRVGVCLGLFPRGHFPGQVHGHPVPLKASAVQTAKWIHHRGRVDSGPCYLRTCGSVFHTNYAR